jgi:uncharacterized protein (TIGR02996 family)
MSDSPSFEFQLPVYLLRNPRGGVCFVANPSGKYLPLFTDDDSAGRFVEARPGDDWSPARVDDRGELLDTLRSAQKAGVGFVIFDPSGEAGRIAPMTPLGHCIDCLAGTGRAAPDDLPAILDRLRAAPDEAAHWLAWADWLRDNGRDDEAAAVRMFHPAIRDSLAMGMGLAEAMELVARHAVKLARLAGSIERPSAQP